MEGVKAMENICLFTPLHPAPDVIQTINFVLETKPQKFDKLTINSTYRAHLVIKGRGLLHLPGSSRPLNCGDLFFISPSMQHGIEGVEDLQYIYISFISVRANQLMERAGVTFQNFFFAGFDELKEPWQRAISSATQENTDLISESLLLYTLGVLIGKRADKKHSAPAKPAELVLQIKKYVEDNITDHALSLSKISRELSYNPKYLSSIFKKHTKVSLFDYINILRCQHACALMEQNITCIKNIAFLCGFDDPLYFSRVFKQKIGISPRDYLKNSIKATEK